MREDETAAISWVPLTRSLAEAATSPGGRGNLSFIVSLDVVLKAEELYAIQERGDRLIAATAAVLDLPLVTRDPRIADAAGVEVVW